MKKTVLIVIALLIVAMAGSAIAADTTTVTVSATVTGFLLAFEGVGRPFREAHVIGLGSEKRIASFSGIVSRPNITGTVRMELGYRFILSEDAQPGTYAWPISISALPI